MSNKGQKPRESAQKRFVRYMCLFLAVLMVFGCVSVLVYVFGGQWNVSADDGAYKFPNDLIAVGLECGASEVAVGFDVSTTNGFVVNKTTIERSVRSAEPVYSLSQSDVTVVCDATLSKVGGDYVKFNGDVAAVGGYHLEIREQLVEEGEVKVPKPFTIQNEEELRTLVTKLEKKLSGSGYAVIPSYIDDKYVIRIGDYSSVEKLEKAKKYIDDHTDITSNYNLVIIEPTNTGVSVVDPNLNQVLFEYDCGGFSQLGLSSKEEGDYLKTYESRTYGGTLAYKRASGGVQVTSLIDFEEYVKCVVPWEISSGWHYNTLTAFSIVVRTYAMLYKNRRMSTYGIDLFDDSNDQNYGGYTKVTLKVQQAVEETKGKLVFYNGSLAQLFYSSSTGGYVISNKYVWGSTTIPYLDTKETPWENYVDRNRGLWVKEVSAEDLSKSLREVYSCRNLTAPIDSVKINSTAGESGYVTSITFTDRDGNTATLGPTSSVVRNSLSDFVTSANFVVGKGSVTYSYNLISRVSLSDTPPSSEPEFVEQNPTYFNKFPLSNFNVLTELNKVIQTSGSSFSLMTFSGRKIVETSRANVLTADRYHKLITDGVDVDNVYNNVKPIDLTVLESTPAPLVQSEGVHVIVDYEVKTVTQTATNPSSFLFAGKGWGHGVGMSQWGMYDLAAAGMSGEDILTTYFPGTEIVQY